MTIKESVAGTYDDDDFQCVNDPVAPKQNFIDCIGAYDENYLQRMRNAAHFLNHRLPAFTSDRKLITCLRPARFEIIPRNTVYLDVIDQHHDIQYILHRDYINHPFDQLKDELTNRMKIHFCTAKHVTQRISPSFRGKQLKNPHSLVPAFPVFPPLIEEDESDVPEYDSEDSEDGEPVTVKTERKLPTSAVRVRVNVMTTTDPFGEPPNASPPSPCTTACESQSESEEESSGNDSEDRLAPSKLLINQVLKELEQLQPVYGYEITDDERQDRFRFLYRVHEGETQWMFVDHFFLTELHFPHNWFDNESPVEFILTRILQQIKFRADEIYARANMRDYGELLNSDSHAESQQRVRSPSPNEREYQPMIIPNSIAPAELHEPMTAEEVEEWESRREAYSTEYESEEEMDVENIIRLSAMSIAQKPSVKPKKGVKNVSRNAARVRDPS
jgi:hypothetical protein